MDGVRAVPRQSCSETRGFMKFLENMGTTKGCLIEFKFFKIVYQFKSKKGTRVLKCCRLLTEDLVCV